MTFFQKIISLLVLIVCIAVIFIPDLYLKSFQIAILYTLAACLPAILFTDMLKAKFDFSWKGISIAAGGTAGFIFSLFILLHYITVINKGPYFTVYNFDYPNGNPAQGLEHYEIDVKPINTSTNPLWCASDNQLFLIFYRENDRAEFSYQVLPGAETKSLIIGYHPKGSKKEILE